MRRPSLLVVLALCASLLLPVAAARAGSSSVVTGLSWWTRPHLDHATARPRADVVLSWGVTVDTAPAGVYGGWWLTNSFREYAWQAAAARWRYLQRFHSLTVAPAVPASVTVRNEQAVQPFVAPRTPGRYQIRLRVSDRLGGDVLKATVQLRVRR
jgi:hypothetical protein